MFKLKLKPTAFEIYIYMCVCVSGFIRCYAQRIASPVQTIQFYRHVIIRYETFFIKVKAYLIMANIMCCGDVELRKNKKLNCLVVKPYLNGLIVSCFPQRLWAYLIQHFVHGDTKHLAMPAPEAL